MSEFQLLSKHTLHVTQTHVTQTQITPSLFFGSTK